MLASLQARFPCDLVRQDPTHLIAPIAFVVVGIALVTLGVLAHMGYLPLGGTAASCCLGFGIPGGLLGFLGIVGLLKR